MAERRENSVLFSLNELRNIESDRVQAARKKPSAPVSRPSGALARKRSVAPRRPKRPSAARKRIASAATSRTRSASFARTSCA